MVIATTVTICAAGLVLFLQYRAISTLQSQTRVILRQISEQTAADVAVELHRVLDGPVFDTLTAVNHPELRARRLDLVAQQYAAGLRTYRHVDRFFIWLAESEPKATSDVMFFGRDGKFAHDPDLSRVVTDLARRYAPRQQLYVAAEGVGPNAAKQVLLRLFWTDARRVEYFAILGFVVDSREMRQQLFAQSTRLRDLLASRGGETTLQLRVTDETGAVVYGAEHSAPESGRVPFPMLFYPAEEIHSRLAAGIQPRIWTIEVNAAPSSAAPQTIVEGYGPTALSILLMLIALALMIQAHRRSVELAKMQSDFVAHVTHQLKTPLSLLSTATETLQMDRVRSPERFAEYLATIHAEAGRLSQLVQRVLEFSRVQQRRGYEFEQVDLWALVRETVDAFAHTLSNQHFSFDVQQDGPAPIVMADSAALEQALVNLLDNAVKYSDAVKQITVRVTSSRRHAAVEISDRGIGIAPPDQARIFDRFYRTSGSSQLPGFGLGLPIVRELIRAHRGNVEVSSALGVGSTFRVILPRCVTERPAEGGQLDMTKVSS
jgi:signal transduction histidine kinase